MGARLEILRSSVRALLGEWAGDRAQPLPPLPDGLSPQLASRAAAALVTLTDYQGVAHAGLYLQRLRRFIGKPGFDEARVARLAELMAWRMCPEDPIRIAQLVLAAERCATQSRRCDYKLSELVSVLPADFGSLLLESFDWIGLSSRRTTRHYDARSAAGRFRLRVEAGTRRWRGLSVSYARERAWVERWLHMIDRAVTKQPAAVEAVMETATMVSGSGEAYRAGLANWHALIDGLVKPTFDGDIVVPDLASAVAVARDAAQANPEAAFKGVIAAIAIAPG